MDAVRPISAGLNYACFGTIAVFLVLFILAIHQKAPLQTIFTSLALVLGAMASQYSLIATSTFQERTMMGTQMLLFVACAVLYRQIDRAPYKLTTTIATSILCVAFAFSLLSVTDVLLRKSIESRQRDESVVASVAAGELDVTVSRIYADIPYCVFDTSITELSSETDFWINQYYAAYWGADSVSALG